MPSSLPSRASISGGVKGRLGKGAPVHQLRHQQAPEQPLSQGFSTMQIDCKKTIQICLTKTIIINIAYIWIRSYVRTLGNRFLKSLSWFPGVFLCCSESLWGQIKPVGEPCYWARLTLHYRGPDSRPLNDARCQRPETVHCETQIGHQRITRLW